MIAQLDVNTIWRRQFGLAVRRRWPDTLLIAPHGFALKKRQPVEEGIVPISLPPGWASRTARLAMPLLHRRLRSLAATRGGLVDTAIFTSFHYLPLARAVARKSRIIYYCSDDYGGYDGWGGDAALAREAEICRLASLSIFVSSALRDRAVENYGLDPATCMVAPNASEARFSMPSELPQGLAELPKPVFGTVGVFGDRIDYDFLDAVAQSASLGSLALVGPVDPAVENDAAIARLRQNAKVHWFGAQPHDQLHRWMAGIDVAVIPYAKSRFNYLCSPMRLWDHLAIGQPILATDACDQVAHHPGIWVVREADTLENGIKQAVDQLASGRNSRLETWDDRAALLAPWLDKWQA